SAEARTSAAPSATWNGSSTAGSWWSPAWSTCAGGGRTRPPTSARRRRGWPWAWAVRIDARHPTLFTKEKPPHLWSFSEEYDIYPPERFSRRAAPRATVESQLL